MSILSNVYCLGCKTRHPQVKIDEVIEMTVKGSIRYQGKGVCENGKTWCKILKPDEIPASYLNKTPNEEVDSITVFEKGVELSSQEPVVEEPVVDVPVVEEPVEDVPLTEEPVVEVPVVEEPVDVPQPLSPADIESFDTPIVPETYEAPQTYYDGTNGLEEQEEETGRVESERPIKPLRLRRTRPFVPQRREPFVDRRMVETEPKPAPIRRINQQDDIEKAKKVGDFMGKSMFNSVGDEYPKYLRANWERTKIPLEHFEHFEAAYLSAGAIKSSEVKAEDGQMDAKTVAGIAGIGILAAWFASQLNNRDSP